jgi:hypothetical protein
MCDSEGVQTLQRGMNYCLKPTYPVILMSQRSSAPHRDRIYDNGVTIEYEGHDVTKKSHEHNPKNEDQPDTLPSGRLTQNGFFIKAVEEYKSQRRPAETVKLYEKLLPGVWPLKGHFDLIAAKPCTTENGTCFVSFCDCLIGTWRRLGRHHRRWLTLGSFLRKSKRKYGNVIKDSVFFAVIRTTCILITTYPFPRAAPA